MFWHLTDVKPWTLLCASVSVLSCVAAAAMMQSIKYTLYVNYLHAYFIGPDVHIYYM